MRLAVNEALTKRLYKESDVAEIVGRPQLVTLADQMGGTFNSEELDVLIFRLGLNREDVGGDTMLSRPFHLVSLCQRHGLLDRLREVCGELRPHLDWNYV